MHVDLALFKGDALLHRCRFLIGSEKGISCYGEHTHFSLSDAEPDGLPVELFSGLVVEHQFDLPACPVGIQLFDVVSTDDLAEAYRQSRVFSASLHMGVHTSEEWESISLGDYTISFWSRPLP